MVNIYYLPILPKKVVIDGENAEMTERFTRKISIPHEGNYRIAVTR